MTQAVFEMLKDYLEETGEVVDGMKVYRLKKPITSKEKILLEKSKNKKRSNAYNKGKEALKRLRNRT